MESLEARSARFRSMMAGRTMLVLLDNARDAEQVRPLLPGHEGCLVIVTSRNQLSSLVVHEGAVPVRLDRMDDEQARELLTQRVGADRLGSDEAAIDRIIRSAAACRWRSPSWQRGWRSTPSSPSAPSRAS